jgi:putative tryptophan/tyrosine transport system substrate-binding protein
MMGGVVASPFLAIAQYPARILQIGFLYPGPQSTAPLRIKAALTGLQAGGLRAPDQLAVVPAVTDGNAALLAPLAANLAARNVDLILAQSGAAVRAANAVTTTIPIVALDLESDPIASGFIASHARPGGNITGVFLDFPEFSKKWLEALNEIVPKLSRVAVFWDPAMAPVQLRAVEDAAQTLNLRLAVVEVRQWSDIEPAFQVATQQDAQALLMLASPLIGGNPKPLAEMALRHRLPAITVFTEFARHGGLMAYGPNLQGVVRQQGLLAARVLLGSKPASSSL